MREAALLKAEQVATKLAQMKLEKAAGKVKESISETLTYYSFPETHWRRIRTNNPLERLMREIRRQTRVVGASPDGEAALMLTAARPGGRSASLHGSALQAAHVRGSMRHRLGHRSIYLRKNRCVIEHGAPPAAAHQEAGAAGAEGGG